MSKAETFGTRLTQERERLGYSHAQLSSLIGLTADELRDVEADKRHLEFGSDSLMLLHRMGVDAHALFTGVKGEDRSSPLLGRGLGFVYQDDFNLAVLLLRHSINVVEAWAGPGMAEKCPELVAATMQATMAASAGIGAGDLEEFADKMVGAAQVIADALAPPED